MISVLGYLYGKILALSNYFYDTGLFRTYKVSVPVISVGNISVGGTGKTPLVRSIALLLHKMGEKPVIISRGYKRSDEGSLVVVSDGERIIEDAEVTGDEPLELALDLKGKASVVCDANRVRGATYAIERLGATVVILDDGFQHRKLGRDLDIVVLDGSAPFVEDRPLPAGRLRERHPAIRRADAFVVTRTGGQVPSSLASVIENIAPKIPVFAATSEIKQIVELSSESPSENGSARNRKYFAFCGIGNPRAFLGDLEESGITIVGSRNFDDHYQYSEKDIDSLLKEAAELEADAFLTTMKDAVKLKEMEIPFECFVVKSIMSIDPEEEFSGMLRRSVEKNGDSSEEE